MSPPSDANADLPPDPDTPTKTATDLPAVLAGRYELGPVLGHGGTASVFRARDRVLDRTVALKVFGRGVVGPDQRRQDHEIRALAHLSHPGLVALYDAGTDDGWAYLAMQLVEGETLADRIGRGPLPVQTTLGIGTALADALTYVHSQGVVHRDLKPANVLLDPGGRPLITDFGIARLVDTTRVTATGYLVGTASYLAPEQVRGQLVGPAADIFAFGLVLLECLTGRREYPGGVLEAAVARLHRAPEVPPDLPPTLAGLLHGMTAGEPAERPTAAEVAHTLHAAAAEAPTSRIGAGAGGTVPMPATGATAAATRTAAAGAAGTAAPPKRRRSAVLTAVGSVVALLVLMAAVLALRNDADAPPAPPSPPPVSRVLPPPTSERTEKTEEASTAEDEPRTTEQIADPTTEAPGPTQPPAAPPPPPAAPPPPPNNSPERPTPSDGGASGQGGGQGDQGGGGESTPGVGRGGRK